MKSIGDQILVEMDKELEDEHHIKGTDITLYVAADYETNKNTRRYGWVYATNDEMEEIGLKKGRKVFFHHFIAAYQHVNKSYESNAIEAEGNKLYTASVGKFNPYDSLVYAYEDEEGNVVPILSYLFCKAIPKENESSILDIYHRVEYDEQYAEVVYLSKECEEAGIKKGDKVRYVKDADYQMDINGEKLFRIVDK